MTAAEFHTLFKTEGERTLAPLGFRYRAHAWHRATADTQLSFCPADTKFGVGFAMKYMTLALWHTSVEPPPSFAFQPFKNNSGFCPVRISPIVLAAFIKANFDNRLWDCPPSGQSPRMTQEPVYFGGPDFRILADPAASREQNQAALLHVLEPDGIDDLSEESTTEIVSRAFDCVAGHALPWAQYASIREVHRLISAHRDQRSPHLLEAWVDSYAMAARR